jgi:hypothetical protein
MSQKMMHALTPPGKMIEMVTYKIISTQSIGDISERVPSACEKFKFTLLQTYVYHEIVESKGFPIKRKVFVY